MTYRTPYHHFRWLWVTLRSFAYISRFFKCSYDCASADKISTEITCRAIAKPHSSCDHVFRTQPIHSVMLNQPAKYLCHRPFSSKFMVRRDRQTDTHSTDYSNWFTKVVVMLILPLVSVAKQCCLEYIGQQSAGLLVDVLNGIVGCVVPGAQAQLLCFVSRQLSSSQFHCSAATRWQHTAQCMFTFSSFVASILCAKGDSKIASVIVIDRQHGRAYGGWHLWRNLLRATKISCHITVHACI